MSRRELHCNLVCHSLSKLIPIRHILTLQSHDYHTITIAIVLHTHIIAALHKSVVGVCYIRQNVHLLSDYSFPARLEQKRQQLRERFQREDVERSVEQCTCTPTNRQRHHIVCKLEKVAFPLQRAAGILS